MTKPVNVGVLCKSGRLHAIADALARGGAIVHILSQVTNSGIASVAKVIKLGQIDDPEIVRAFATRYKLDFVVIGPEEPLAAGIVDMLAAMGIPSIGPTKLLAQLETSKVFTRTLLGGYPNQINPEYRIFRGMDGIESFMRKLGHFVVKPDGLTGGKGVKVFGDHLHSISEALAYCTELLANGMPLLVEEKLEGEEFSLQSFCDGKNLAHTIPVQDHKRAKEGDVGSNTGGIGSYSCENHELPFLPPEFVAQAKEVNSFVAHALEKQLGAQYKGIIYGNFILTRDGLRVIEYNARFGDPEGLNVLSILKTNFVDICLAIIAGTLDAVHIELERKATVCKYVVPKGYPDNPAKDAVIDVSQLPPEGGSLRIFYAAVDTKIDGRLHLTGSRAIAFVGIAPTVAEAEKIAESAAQCVHGPVYHRRDIGTAELIERRVQHMKDLRSPQVLNVGFRATA